MDLLFKKNNLSQKIIYIIFYYLWFLKFNFKNLFCNSSKVVAGATTLSTMIFSIMTLNVMTFRINVTLSIMTFNVLAEYCYAECYLSLGVI